MGDRVESFFSWCRSNPFTSLLIIGGTIFTSLSSFSDSLSKASLDFPGLIERIGISNSWYLTVHITSKPDGAEVFEGDTPIGVTPFDRRVRRATYRYTFKRKYFRPTERIVDLNSFNSQWETNLDPDKDQLIEKMVGRYSASGSSYSSSSTIKGSARLLRTADGISATAELASDSVNSAGNGARNKLFVSDSVSIPDIELATDSSNRPVLSFFVKAKASSEKWAKYDVTYSVGAEVRFKWYFEDETISTSSRDVSTGKSFSCGSFRRQ